jgi:hypothetical protein
MLGHAMRRSYLIPFQYFVGPKLTHKAGDYRVFPLSHMTRFDSVCRTFDVYYPLPQTFLRLHGFRQSLRLGHQGRRPLFDALDRLGGCWGSRYRSGPLATIAFLAGGYEVVYRIAAPISDANNVVDL